MKVVKLACTLLTTGKMIFFLGIKATDDIIHLPIKRTPAGGFIAKYGNNEAVSRDSLTDLIEHFQISPLSLGDGTAEVLLTEPQRL